jgi:hypothetical protein
LGKKEQDTLNTKVSDAGPPSDQKPTMTLKGTGGDDGRSVHEFDDDGNLILDLVEPVDLNANLKATEYSTKVYTYKCVCVCFFCFLFSSHRRHSRATL